MSLPNISAQGKCKSSRNSRKGLIMFFSGLKRTGLVSEEMKRDCSKEDNNTGISAFSRKQMAWRRQLGKFLLFLSQHWGIKIFRRIRRKKCFYMQNSDFPIELTTSVSQ